MKQLLDKDSKLLLTGKINKLKDVLIFTTSDNIAIKYDVNIKGEIIKHKLNTNIPLDVVNKMSEEEIEEYLFFSLPPQLLPEGYERKGLFIDDVIYKLKGKIIVSNIRINDIKIKDKLFNEIKDKIELEINEYYITKRMPRFM